MEKVLIISRDLIPSVKLCGDSQLAYLKENGIIDYRFVQSHLVTSDILNWADVVIFVRSESELEYYVSKICKKAGKQLIYVLDDDLLNVPSYLGSAEYYNLKEIRRNFKKIMANCSVFLTPSKILLEKYGHLFKYSYLIKEPSLNPVMNKPTNNNIKIGFAGSIDRSTDIADILSESLREVLAKYKDKVEIEFMGAKPDFVDELGLKYIPYTKSYDEYVNVIRNRDWDIGLAPMPDTNFHACKYINKYVEYASFGIAGIYSNVEPYKGMLEDGKNCLLADNTTESWTNSISRMIEDKDLLNSIRNMSLKDVKDNYNIKKLAKEYYEYILMDYKKSDKKVDGMWKFRVQTILHRTICKILKKEALY